MVLFVGLALAILMAVVEFMWNSRKNAHREHRSGIQVGDLIEILCSRFISFKGFHLQQMLNDCYCVKPRV